jgi:HSP20 family protein
MSTTPTLSRWDPFRELSRVQEHVNRFFEDNYLRRAGESSLTAWAPEVDIHETPDALVLEADLPGINEKDLDIRVENNMLTIRGERKFEKKVSEENYLRVERAYGAFTRSFSLPHTVNTEQIQANYEKGVLTVRLPKREEAKPKQIKVSVTAGK